MIKATASSTVFSHCGMPAASGGLAAVGGERCPLPAELGAGAVAWG